MRIPLWAKLALAFVLVALTAILLVAALANRATAVGFQRYLQTGDSNRLERLAEDLGLFYGERANWSGVNALLRDSDVGPEVGSGGYFLRVIDSNGAIIASRGGQGRDNIDFDLSYPIMSAGTEVGTLLAAAAGQGERAAEQFLASVNQALIWAGGAAVIVALLLGILLARRLTQPLNQLTSAAQAVAGGDLEQQVPVSSRDELGDLARDFNQMAQALRLSEVQRRQMLADTAHDLRTPISVMRSHLEAMLDGVFEPTPENLAVVHEETLLLSRLVDDVRTLSLAEAGQLPLTMEEVNLVGLVQAVAAAFAPLAEADGIQMTVETVPVPSTQGDPARLQQLLSNLLANALRYAPQGNADEPWVNITLASAGDSIQIAISDSGPGLSAEQQAQVFDRFWRSDAARNRNQGGSGLGLAIAQGIARAHAGEITVDSVSGSGSTFTLVLPATAARNQG